MKTRVIEEILSGKSPRSVLGAQCVVEVDWVTKYMSQLVGGKITSVGTTDGFPSFEVDHPKLGKLTISVSSDEEGNGPGFLFGLPQVGAGESSYEGQYKISKADTMKRLKQHSKFKIRHGETMVDGDRARTQDVHDAVSGDYILTIYTAATKGGAFIK